MSDYSRSTKAPLPPRKEFSAPDWEETWAIVLNTEDPAELGFRLHRLINLAKDDKERWEQIIQDFVLNDEGLEPEHLTQGILEHIAEATPCESVKEWALGNLRERGVTEPRLIGSRRNSPAAYRGSLDDSFLPDKKPPEGYSTAGNPRQRRVKFRWPPRVTE